MAVDEIKNGAPLLAVNNIEVIYDHVILVLKGVSLEVPEGGIVALLGANGAASPTCSSPSAATSPRVPSSSKASAPTSSTRRSWCNAA